jgi:hypothetical protein
MAELANQRILTESASDAAARLQKNTGMAGQVGNQMGVRQASG